MPIITSRNASRPATDIPKPGRDITSALDGSSKHSSQDRLNEASGLARAIDLNVIETKIVTIPAPKPGTLFGSGKVKELSDLVKDNDIELVIVDHTLSPIQQSNLELAWKAKVLDRTGLILEIFGDRARTREGLLQVELAHLTYQKGRLVRAWTHLERQRGGSAFLGGPGEAQIELDRRMIDGRIETIKRDLAQVVRTRELHRAGRRKTPYPIVSLVGYTNAGKSTLFNILTGSNVVVQDQVFATLDPTMREVQLPSGRRIILSDTVGFISDLPTMLVAAFRATLEEVIEADLILHVRDIAHPESQAQCSDVKQILCDLGIDLDTLGNDILEVWNKADLLPANIDEDARFQRQLSETNPALVSATMKTGINELLDRIDTHFGQHDVEMSLVLKSTDGKLRHWLYEHAQILDHTNETDGTSTFHVRLSPQDHGRLISRLAQ